MRDADKEGCPAIYTPATAADDNGDPLLYIYMPAVCLVGVYV